MTSEPEPYRAAFFFDCGSGYCLWSADDRTRDRFDYPIEHDELPLSSAVIAKLTELCDRVDRSLNWDYPPDPGPWRQDECDRFNADVADVIARLRAELGAAWEIEDEFVPLAEDPDLDRYLADPKGFRRQAANQGWKWRIPGRLRRSRNGRLGRSGTSTDKE